ncbi:hypothetical protein GCM10010339_69270 [Streptomyces alanosinicus]|uniref:Uncharacterized protein n=1 Tax=Streptomyces alanosinicus TaxID=68171 RepID=A0A919D5Z0_9ACTN|nr:hypothetical protein GCM10010339_69270 [Streptomyces alanosinicus]
MRWTTPRANSSTPDVSRPARVTKVMVVSPVPRTPHRIAPVAVVILSARVARAAYCRRRHHKNCLKAPTTASGGGPALASNPLDQHSCERGRAQWTEAAALKCVYMELISLDPTSKDRRRWAMRWKAPLNAFQIAFEGRLTPTTSN